MTEFRDVPAVALLFADAELSGHLREALSALGARIVHQGPAAQVSADVLRDSGADVVVVNLEPADEEHLEHLYAALEQGSCQVVFNDAEASRNLSGWDKARWARHLAAKLVGSNDVDPPRPLDARKVDVDAGMVPAAPSAISADAPVPGNVLSDTSDASVMPSAATSDVADGAGQSDQLEAELEALLATGSASGAGDDVAADATVAEAPPKQASAPRSVDVDVEARQTVATPAPAADWELIDMNAAPAVAPAAADPQQFGIDKVSAESFLKPDSGAADSALEPGLELELVSLEESVAPTMGDAPVSEMMLDADGRAVRDVVVISAGSAGVPECERFLAGLSATTACVVLLLAPPNGPSVDALATTLQATSARPVAVVDGASRTRHGGVLLVPPGHSCRLDRDGRFDLVAAQTAPGPSVLEQCLADVTRTFGGAVTAIVLTGSGPDAVTATRHVRDGGGQVWIPDLVRCADDATINAIHADGSATFVGAPEDLARHLCEAHA